jgi:hypothetical protein
MYAQISGGEVIRVIKSPVELEVGGKKHPRHIFLRWSKPKLAAIGIYPYRENRTDSRYYHTGQLTYEIGEDEVVGTYAKISKDVDTLKKQMLDNVKQIASSLLVRDDWMAVRASEGGTAIPDVIKAYRVAIRQESNDKEAEIAALTTLTEVITYQNCPYMETRKEEITADDGTVSYGDNYESERHLDLSSHYFAEDPMEDDPAFISLVKK